MLRRTVTVRRPPSGHISTTAAVFEDQVGLGAGDQARTAQPFGDDRPQIVDVGAGHVQQEVVGTGDEVDVADGGDAGQRLDFLAKQLDGKPYLTGDKFTVPDAYLFTVLSWAPHLKISLDRWPTLKTYVERVAGRPQVQAALKAEGLAK